MAQQWKVASRGVVRASRQISIEARRFSSARGPPKRPSFLTTFIENIRQGLRKEKDIQESLKKLQEESEKSSSLKSVKETLDSAKVKAETAAWEGSTAIKSVYERLRTATASMYGKVSQTEVAKEAKDVSDKILEEAKETAEKVAKQGQELGKTEAFKTIKKGFGELKGELFDEAASKSEPYKAPNKLRKRSALNAQEKEKIIQPDDTTTTVVMHKDSKWASQWKAFKDDNPVLNRLFELKMKYDESDNFLIRVTRTVTDRVTDIFGGAFSQTEMAATLTEIAKIDPTFEKAKFLHQCEKDIIPTILEAFLSQDLDVLKDWCHDSAFAIFSTLIEQDKQFGRKNETKVLDIRGVDIIIGKVMELGPVLVVSFNAQQLSTVRDSKGEIIGEDNIENVNYIWALCRDQSVFDPSAAWRLLEFGVNTSSAWV